MGLSAHQEIFGGKDMTKKKSWDDIPSIEGLEVDWKYEPENTLGKRAWARMTERDLLSLFDAQSLPVQVAAKNFDGVGSLVDIGQSGLAVLLDTKLAVTEQVKIGFFLGKQKVVSRAVIKNVGDGSGRHRTGMEFMDFNKDYESFIAGLVSTKSYSSLM